jgi:predicted RNA methylase
MSDAETSHLQEHLQLLPSTRYAATVVLNILDEILDIKSILDLGCGIGVWMEVALRKPGRVVLGIDREALAPEHLLVAPDLMLNLSLSEKIDLQRRFDLVLCLETAEHIRFEHASEVVSNCARHADLILFSAAIPGQGGLHHVNEQLPEYWQHLFDENGYEVVDHLRPLIWNDARVPKWYRQNVLLFVNRTAATKLDLLQTRAKQASIPLSRAHPEFLLQQASLAHAEAMKARIVSELEHERASLNDKLIHLRKQRKDLQRALTERSAAIQHIERQRLELHALVQSHNATVAEMTDRIAMAEQARDEVLRSTFWRATLPGRALLSRCPWLRSPLRRGLGAVFRALGLRRIGGSG